MIHDKLLELAENQLILGPVGTNILCQLAAGQAIGHECWLEIQVAETAESDFAATLRLALETAAEEGFGDKFSLAKSDAIEKADLIAGAIVWRIKIPAGAKKYLRVYLIMDNGVFTKGKLDVRISGGISVLP